jgi:hypothetical protein
MKRLLLALSCCLAVTAQQSTKPKMESCGSGTSHDCRCISRTRAVQDAYSETCRLNSKTDKEMHECMSRVPPHCSIVDRYTGDGDDNGAEEQDPAMAERCTMMCKKHDCFCDDGPRCHIGHEANEHEESHPKAKPGK